MCSHSQHCFFFIDVSFCFVWVPNHRCPRTSLASSRKSSGCGCYFVTDLPFYLSNVSYMAHRTILWSFTRYSVCILVCEASELWKVSFMLTNLLAFTVKQIDGNWGIYFGDFLGDTLRRSVSFGIYHLHRNLFLAIFWSYLQEWPGNSCF